MEVSDERIGQAVKWVVQIAVGKDQKKPEMVGSGFLIKIAGVPFLITAAHVLEDIEKLTAHSHNLFLNPGDGHPIFYNLPPESDRINLQKLVRKCFPDDLKYAGETFADIAAIRLVELYVDNLLAAGKSLMGRENIVLASDCIDDFSNDFEILLMGLPSAGCQTISDFKLIAFPLLVSEMQTNPISIWFDMGWDKKEFPDVQGCSGGPIFVYTEENCICLAVQSSQIKGSQVHGIRMDVLFGILESVIAE